MMSSKRRNSSRWHSPRSATTAAPLQQAAAAAPPAAAASAPPARASPAAAARNSSPHVAAPTPPRSDFTLDYRYEFSVPAQMLLNRLERQPWLDQPLSDYSAYSAARESSGYGSPARSLGPLTRDAPSQLEESPLINRSSRVVQHYAGAYQNKAELSGQLLPGMASETVYLDLERDRWRAAALARYSSSLYGLPSGPGDVGQSLPLAHALELASGKVLGGGSVDAKILDGKAVGASLGGGEDNLKGRDISDKLPMGLQDPKLYCSACDRAFTSAHQKEAHLQSHVKCEEQHCQFEATARKVKEHMLSEHGKQFKTAGRAISGSQKEVEGTHASENQKVNFDKTDKTQNEHADARGDARNEAELVARKSRESRHYRVPGRYFPY